jgi:hypothetical protein
VELIGPFMDRVVEEFQLNVAKNCSHQYEKGNAPCGATIIYLLSERVQALFSTRGLPASSYPDSHPPTMETAIFVKSHLKK